MRRGITRAPPVSPLRFTPARSGSMTQGPLRALPTLARLGLGPRHRWLPPWPTLQARLRVAEAARQGGLGVAPGKVLPLAVGNTSVC